MRHRHASKNSVSKDIPAVEGTATALAREYHLSTMRHVEQTCGCHAFLLIRVNSAYIDPLSYPAHWEVWHGIVSILDFVCLMVEFRKRLLKLHSGERRSRLSAPSIGGR